MEQFSFLEQFSFIAAFTHFTLLSSACSSDVTNKVTSQLGDNQLGDSLFRLSDCFVLIEQNKLSKKAVLSQGK